MADKLLPDTVRTVLTGGEALAVPLAISVLKGWGAGRVRLLNMYGPCEATILTNIFEPCDSDSDNEEPGRSWAYNFSPQCMPLGPALENTSCYVLDPLHHQAACRAVLCLCNVHVCMLF